MKQPPEPPEFRTDRQILTDTITTACTDLRRDWPHMIREGETQPVGAAPTSGVLLDDHDPRDADQRRIDKTISLRRLAQDQLNGWCRVIIEDRPVTNNATVPSGVDVPGMVTFLATHADWISGHEAATDCRDEVRDLADQVHAITDPFRKEWHRLGSCPFYLDEHDQFCTGTVRIHVSAEDDVAECTDCGQFGPSEWWEEVLGVAEVEVANASRMAEILSLRLRVTVTERTVRNWARDGRISPMVPFGPQPARARWWFDARTVLAQVARMDRECPTCGRLWSGEGKVCGRCWSAQRDAQATYSDDVPAYPVVPHVRRAPKPRPDLVQDERSTRCTYSDLPLRWCGCGREHVAS